MLLLLLLLLLSLLLLLTHKPSATSHAKDRLVVTGPDAEPRGHGFEVLVQRMRMRGTNKKRVHLGFMDGIYDDVEEFMMICFEK